MSNTPVQSLAQSANQSGLSSSAPPAGPVAACPGTQAANENAVASTVYDYCDLSNAIIEWTNGTAAYSVTLDKRRRDEKVAPSVFNAYKGPLASHELVIEALADFRNETSQGGQVTATDGVKPLNVRAGGFNSSSHTSFQPAHPHVSIKGEGVDASAYGASQAEAKIALREWGAIGGSTTFGRLWPFGGKREYTIEAKSCGCPNGKPAVGDLRAHMVVFPYEEWKLTFGLGPILAGSAEAARNRMKKSGPGKSEVSTVYTIKKTVGSTETTSEKAYVGKDNYSESYKVKVADSKVLTSNTRELTESDNTWAAKPDLKDESDSELRKISIERSFGGLKVEFDVSENVKRIMKFKETVDDIKDVLGSVKLGWSISASYSILSGKISFGWGYRYPEGYREENRVYYVERVISVGGTCTFIDGKVEGMFGLEVDPWWAPVTVVAKIYVSIGVKVDLSASASIAYTNWATIHQKSSKGDSIDLGFASELSLELGAKAGGRAMGYGVDARLALEGKLTLDIKGKLTFSNPPSWIANVKSEEVKLVGEILTIGKTTDRYAFKPRVLIEAKDFVKDKKLWA